MVAMSGGVDSGVAACLMSDQGYECIGATMILTPQTTGNHSSDVKNIKDAGSVSGSIGIPYYTFDFSDSFRRIVVDDFVNTYLQGRTPNPCIICNRHLKFGMFLDKAEEMSCDLVATGHYARVARDDDSGRYLLKKALDPTKDQSYVLSFLTQRQLAHVRFPLGEMTKSEVRRIAQERDLCVAEKQESQDICFIRDESYAEFIESYANEKYPEGDFIDKNGKILGRHKGILHYTIGQRKGLGIAFGEPMYVIRIDPEANTVVLGSNDDLFSDTLTAGNLNLISCDRIRDPMRVKAKIRYRHPAQWATVEQVDDSIIKVVFDEPQRAVTPGQAVVLYDDDVVVGGATIIQ